MDKQVLSVRRYKIGYEVRKEQVDGEPYGTDGVVIASAYTILGGLYLGSSRWAHRLYARGIKPELKLAPFTRRYNAGSSCYWRSVGG